MRAAVVAGGAGRRDQRMRASGQVQRQVEPVTADDAAGRVHQHVVADLGPLGVERLEHAQRALVQVVGDGARAVAAVAQPQAGVPAWGEGAGDREQVRHYQLQPPLFARPAPYEPPVLRRPPRIRLRWPAGGPCRPRPAGRLDRSPGTKGRPDSCPGSHPSSGGGGRGAYEKIPVSVKNCPPCVCIHDWGGQSSDARISRAARSASSVRLLTAVLRNTA